MAHITTTVSIRQRKPDGRSTPNPNRQKKQTGSGSKTQSAPTYKTCGTCGGTGLVRAR